MAGAISRVGDVTKLLQTQRRDSQWRMQDFVNGGAFPPFSKEPTRSETRGVSPWEIFEISRIVENYRPTAVRKKCATSTSQSNNFGITRKSLKSSTPGSSCGNGQISFFTLVSVIYYVRLYLIFFVVVVTLIRHSWTGCSRESWCYS